MSAIGPASSVSTRPAPDGVVLTRGRTVNPVSGRATSAPAVPKVRFPSWAVTTSSRSRSGAGTFIHSGYRMVATRSPTWAWTSAPICMSPTVRAVSSSRPQAARRSPSSDLPGIGGSPGTVGVMSASAFGSTKTRACPPPRTNWSTA